VAAIAAADARPDDQPYFLRADALRERPVDFFAPEPLFPRELEAVERFVERDAVDFDVERVDVFRAGSVRAAPARVAAALPTCLTASPAAFAADLTPVAAPLAALRA
jgi:hypothetical protein